MWLCIDFTPIIGKMDKYSKSPGMLTTTVGLLTPGETPIDELGA